MIRIVQLLLLFLLYLPVAAQEAKQYTFRHFSIENGLASNAVKSVVQDKDGYIWIGTHNGLQRYDGGSFISFKYSKKNESAIPSDRINRLFSDKSNNLWMVSDHNTVGIFNTRNFSFQPTEIPNKGMHGVQHFLEMPNGDFLLLLSNGVLYKYNKGIRSFERDDQSILFPPRWGCNQIAFDRQINKYWLSCDSGLALFDPRTRNISYYGHNTDKDPAIEAFKNQPAVGVFTDGRGTIIFGFWPYMGGGPNFYRYSRRTNKAEMIQLGSQLGYYEPKGELVQENGRIWLYGMPFFAEWPTDQTYVLLVANEYKTDQSLKFDYANSAYEDREHNIWIATDNGLFMFNPDAQIFNSYKLVRTDAKPAIEVSVAAVTELKNGNILVGCWGAGVFSYDKNFNPVPLPKGFEGTQLSVWDMAIHPKTGELWITLQGGGVAVYNEETKKLKQVFPEIFGGSTIRQVDEDTSGNLWFGTQNGKLIKWDYQKAGNDPSKGYELIAKTGMVLKVHYDYQGYIWVGTNGRGLWKLDARTNKVIKTFTDDGPEGERLFINSVGDMTYYNDSILIVSSGAINILNTRTNKISYISTDEGLPSNTTESIEKDEKGILWIGMTNGICRMDMERQLIAYYDRRDGISYDKFNQAGVKELKDGRIIFFTDHNFLAFDPRKFERHSLPPVPTITGFKLAGRSLSVDSLRSLKKPQLRYNNTSIAINFSGLTYLQQQKTYYYYMLDGLDKDWISIDHPAEVVYNYLAPGNYIFKVKSETADGNSSEQIAMLPLTVREPFWKSWWFYSFLVLIALGILYLLDRERMNKIRSLQQVRRQIRLNLRDEVSNTLNNINVLSEIAKIKADKNVEQAKDFIDQISDKSRHMIDAMDDTLWSIDPANDSMKKFVLRIKEVTEGMHSASGTDIDLIVDHKVQLMELDMKLRHELFFFYKEAMQFIVQHIACDQIFVNLNKVKSKILIEILTECQGNAEDLKARFKSAIDRRVQSLNATIDVMADSKSFAVVLNVEP